MPESETSKQHIEKLEPKESHKKGCVSKHVGTYKNDRCSYRYNGYQEMSTTRKSLYQIDFTKKVNFQRLPWIYQVRKIGTKGTMIWAPDPTANKTAWWFNGTNYKVNFLPWNLNYHHILPFDSIKQLSYKELDWLQWAEYNLNDKDNMIILPCLDAYGIAMKLPSHPYNHPDYNLAVKQVVNSIKQDIKETTKTHLRKKDMKDFKDKLVSWEKRQFTQIVKYGKKLAKAEAPENPSEPDAINSCPVATA